VSEQRRWADQAFHEFWKRYPRKVGKIAARKAWDKARPTPELFEQMKRTLAWQVQQWDDPKFIPHPATWISQGRWDDEPFTPVVTKRTKTDDLIAENSAVMADLMGKRDGLTH
jgi:hypothetical protein